MNKVLLVGRLVRDPQINEVSSGVKYARITLAIDKPFKNLGADFVPVILWKQPAEFTEKYLVKGNKVWVEGRFESSTYEKDGKKITNYQVAATTIQSLEKTQTTKQGQEENTKIQKNKIEMDIPWDENL